MNTAIAVFIAVTAALSTSAAFAQEATPAEKPKVSMAPQGLFYTDGHVSPNGDFLSLGYFPVQDLTVYAGLGFQYNPNGSVKSAPLGLASSTSPNDKFGMEAILAAAYFVVDKAPVAMGPEVAAIASLAPANPLDTVIIEPLWAIRYAPWSAPVAIGTDIGVSFTFLNNSPAKSPIVSSATAGFHIIYVLGG